MNVCNDVLQHWDLCVYVRRKGVDVTHFRDEYLKHMGGQSQVVCAVHGFLVTIHSFKGDKCCFLRDDEYGSRCNGRGIYSCPVKGCTAHVCSEHVRSSEGQNGIRVVPWSSHEVDARNDDEDDVSH